MFFLQNDEFSNQIEDSSSQISILIFENSRRKEINNLLKRRVFELIIIETVSWDIRIFNFRFVDEIKHLSTSDAYEKFRLVIQAYNDQNMTLILIQSFIIQRISQRIILALAVITKHNLYLRDITQTYVQSKIPFNRESFIRLFLEVDLSKNSIFRVVKSLYNVLETETHWCRMFIDWKEWIANCCLSNLDEKPSPLYRNSLSTISSTDPSSHDPPRSPWEPRSSVVTRSFLLI